MFQEIPVFLVGENYSNKIKNLYEELIKEKKKKKSKSTSSQSRNDHTVDSRIR